MNKLIIASFFLLACVQTALAKDAEGFPLKLHITSIEMQQGTNPVRGRGYTDSNGNYRSSVGGGGTYYWHLFTARIDGDAVTYKLSSNGRFMKGPAMLQIGDYSARWNKNGTLEVQYTNSKGKLVHEKFQVQAASKE